MGVIIGIIAYQFRNSGIRAKGWRRVICQR